MSALDPVALQSCYPPLQRNPTLPPLAPRSACIVASLRRLKESMSINQSVSAVRRVFETLRFNQSHPTLQQVVPYRSNKLTLLLKPLFTGKAGKLATFVVLLTAYPGQRDYDEKRGTLKVRRPGAHLPATCPVHTPRVCEACRRQHPRHPRSTIPSSGLQNL